MAPKFNPRAIRLIVGLGNPAEEYGKTYHNMGMMFTDALLKRLAPGAKSKRSARRNFRYAKAGKLVVAAPSGFMNESGSAFKKALSFFGCAPKEVLVAHDENDLPFGEYRIDFGKGAAGHKGISSIISGAGTKDFWRLRLGIQPKTAKRKRAGDFVLSRLSKADETAMRGLFDELIRRYFA